MDQLNELIQIHDGQPVTTSLKISEVFEKSHKDVLKAMKNIEVSEEFGRRNFAPTSYIDQQNKTCPMYYLTEKGATRLITAFSGKKASVWIEKYIEAFDEMRKALLERRLLPDLMRVKPMAYHPIYLDQEFKRGIHHIMGVKPPKHGFHPSAGKFLRNKFYKPMGVIDDLDRVNPLLENGKRKFTHHQFLTSEEGRPVLIALQSAFKTCARIAQGNPKTLRMLWDSYLAQEAGEPIQLGMFLLLTPERGSELLKETKRIKGS